MSLFDDVTPEQMEFGGGNDWFPTGDYEFTIQDTFDGTLGETADGEPFEGFVTSDGEQLSILVGDFVPVNGGPNPPGNNTAFIRITLRDGDTTIHEVAADDKTLTQLAKSRRRLAALAAHGPTVIRPPPWAKKCGR